MRRRGPPPDFARRAAIVAAYAEHGTTRAAAKALGIAQSTVSYALAKSGVTPPRGRPRKFAQAVVVAAVERLGGIAAAARDLGITSSAVAYTLRSLGIRIRRPGRPPKPRP